MFVCAGALVLRKLFAATGVALVVLASQGAVAWAATPPPAAVADDDQGKAQAILDRAQVLTQLLDEVSGSIQGVDLTAVSRAPTPQTVASVVAQLEQSQVAASRAAARLRALPAWTGTGEDDRLIAAASRDAVVFADDVVELIGAMRTSLTLAGKGDKAAFQKAQDKLMSGGVKMLVGQALSARTRAAMMPKDAADRHIVLAQAEIYEGFGSVLSYSGGFTEWASAAKALRTFEANVRKQTIAGREREFDQVKSDRAELADGLLDPVLRAAFDRQHALQLDVFKSLERSADALGAIAGKLEASGGKRLQLRPDMLPLEKEESVQSQLMQEQMAAYQQMVDRANELAK